MEKYKLKLKTEDGKDYDEDVEIDTEKETETFHVPKTSPDKQEADIVFDFKKVSVAGWRGMSGEGRGREGRGDRRRVVGVGGGGTE